MSSMTQVKAGLASIFTVTVAGIERWFDGLNQLAIDYMPLLTAFGIVSGACLTAFYYSVLAWHKRQDIKQRQRQRALEHKRMEHEARMAAREQDDHK